MATNLIALLTQLLTPDVIAKMASALGLDRTIAQKAIGAVIPALLACLGNAVSKPGGERQLGNAIAQQPDGALDSLIRAITGSGQKSLAEQKSFVESGSSLLSGLLGGSTQDSLTRTIGRYAGISEGTSKSLLGMLGPVVLDTLGQQQRSAGLDTGGLANLLTSQRQQIVRAIPSGLAEQMNVGGLVDALEDSVRGGTAAAAASRISSAPAATIARASQAAPEVRRAPAQWPYWVLGLAALSGLGWLLFANWGGQRVAEQPRPATVTEQPRPPAVAPQPRGETVGVGAANLIVGGVNLADQVNSSIGALRTTLGGITDAASAQAALPKLREVMGQLDRVNALSAQLPAESRRALATLIASAMPAINSAIEKILATPGVGEVARPAINDLRTRLDTLARA
jgi:hypothetical protein